VTITEFSDFECPACYRLSRSLETLRARYPDRIAIVYRNYPLNDLHPYARAAAIAASCASSHGRFAAYHDSLFSHRTSLETVNWTRLAAQVGVEDTSAFASCLTSPSVVASLVRDSTAAAALRIPGTPLVLVNEWLFRGGAPAPPVLDSLVQRALSSATQTASTSP
jgi:protein-disulfide isomerase